MEDEAQKVVFMAGVDWINPWKVPKC